MNFTIDTTNNSIIDWNSTINPLIDADLNITDINNYTSPCNTPFADGCLVPLNLSSDGNTNVTLSNLRLNNFIFITVLDENTGNNVSSGITVRILNITSGSVLFSKDTDPDGLANFSNVSFGGNTVNAGKSGSSYPTIRTVNFTHTAPNTSVTMRLCNVNDCLGGIVQVVDSQFLEPIPNALVRVFRDGNLVNEELTDTTGLISDSFTLSTLYFFNVSAPGFVEQTSLLTFVGSPFVFRLDRVSPIRVSDDVPVITTFPQDLDVLQRDGSVCFGMIARPPSDKTFVEFGIIYGIDPTSLVDDTVPATQSDFKFEITNSTSSSGGAIDCNTGVGSALNLSVIQGDKLFLRFYYRFTGESERRHILRTFTFTSSVQGRQPGATDFFGGIRDVLADLGFEELGIALIAFLIILEIVRDLASREVGFKALGTVTWLLVGLFTLIDWIPWYIFFFSTMLVLVLGIRILRSFE